MSFAIGRSWRLLVGLLLRGNNLDDDHEIPARTVTSSLSDQIQAQTEIQHLIHKVTDLSIVDCSSNRVLASELEQPKDGFASEFQYVARLMQMAVSTNRLLVLTPKWTSAYSPPDCSGWECLWDPISKCPIDALETKFNNKRQLPVKDDHDDAFSQLRIGILPQKQSSSFFDVGWYGLNRVAWSPTSFSRREDRVNLRADVIPDWERALGRYWIRAQMAHYLWKPNEMLRAQIQQRLPSLLLLTGDKEQGNPAYIGFHIRYTDNIIDFQRHFARNATQSKSFSRFMQFAEQIRKRYPDKRLAHIYLATDNNHIVEQSQHQHWEKLGWKFITQNDVQRSTTQDRLWFRSSRTAAAAAIATDLEVLRRADYLVGSFQSNVYRLACELNTAWHVKTYPFEMQRHWTVDVEWYEDP